MKLGGKQTSDQQRRDRGSSAVTEEDLASASWRPVLRPERCINQAKGVQEEEQERHVKVPGVAEVKGKG